MYSLPYVFLIALIIGLFGGLVLLSAPLKQRTRVIGIIVLAVVVATFFWVTTPRGNSDTDQLRRDVESQVGINNDGFEIISLDTEQVVFRYKKVCEITVPLAKDSTGHYVPGLTLHKDGTQFAVPIVGHDLTRMLPDTLCP